MSRSAVIGLALCMLPILSVAAAPTPSFDCLRAQSPVEKTICQQAELAELDRQLNSAYWQFIKQLPNAQQETARQMQRNWIRAREQDCRQNEPSINWFTPEPASSYQENNSANGESRLSECIKTYLNDQIHHLNKGILVSMVPIIKSQGKLSIGLPGITAIVSKKSKMNDELAAEPRQVEETAYYLNQVAPANYLGSSADLGEGVENQTIISRALRSYLLHDGRLYHAFATTEYYNSGVCTSSEMFNLHFFGLENGHPHFFKSREDTFIPYRGSNSACGYSYHSTFNVDASEQGLYFDIMSMNNGVFTLLFPETRRYIINQDIGQYEYAIPLEKNLDAFHGYAYKKLYQQVLENMKPAPTLSVCQQINNQFITYQQIKANLAAQGISREQAFYTITHQGKKLNAYPALAYFKPGIQALLRYLDHARQTADWEEKLPTAASQYPEPNQHGLKAEISWQQEPFRQAGFYHADDCFATSASPQSDMSLEAWMYAFWARRLMDNTLEQSEQVLRLLLAMPEPAR